MDAEVFALAASPDGSRLYVGGNFNTVNGKTQKKIAVFNTATGALIAWKPTGGWPNNVIRAIAVGPSTIYIGGEPGSLGVDAVWAEITDLDRKWLERKLRQYDLLPKSGLGHFRKIVAGKQLWNYDNLEPTEKKLVL